MPRGPPLPDAPDNRLRELRQERGMSRAEVAYKLGVSENTVARWERREVTIPTERIIDLAELLGVGPADVMGWRS